jgi:hypothetical protein
MYQHTEKELSVKQNTALFLFSILFFRLSIIFIRQIAT